MKKHHTTDDRIKKPVGIRIGPVHIVNNHYITVLLTLTVLSSACDSPVLIYLDHSQSGIHTT